MDQSRQPDIKGSFCQALKCTMQQFMKKTDETLTSWLSISSMGQAWQFDAPETKQSRNHQVQKLQSKSPVRTSGRREQQEVGVPRWTLLYLLWQKTCQISVYFAASQLVYLYYALKYCFCYGKVYTFSCGAKQLALGHTNRKQKFCDH